MKTNDTPYDKSQFAAILAALETCEIVESNDSHEEIAKRCARALFARENKIKPQPEGITPLPWAATNCASHVQIHREGWPRDAWSVANVGTQAQDQANAAFIVRACNEYDHLKDVEKRHEVALQMLKERSEREAALVAALQALAATARTFRGVPKDEQEWTPIDEETLDHALALLSTLKL